MIGEVMFKAFSGFYGGTFGNVLSQLESMGVFSYILPFLIIFALISAILSQVKLFQDNKAINTIIAFAVGLMALQFEFVPQFFSEIFPRLGIGLAIILVVIIVLGFFRDPDNKGLNITLLIVGAIIVIIVLYNTAAAFDYGFAGALEDNLGGIIIAVVAIAAIIFIIASVNKTNKPGDEYKIAALKPSS